MLGCGWEAAGVRRELRFISKRAKMNFVNCMLRERKIYKVMMIRILLLDVLFVYNISFVYFVWHFINTNEDFQFRNIYIYTATITADYKKTELSLIKNDIQ